MKTPVIKFRLDELIAREGITASEFACRAGIRPALVSKMRRDKITRFDVANLTKIIKYFELKNMDELFTIDWVEEDTQ